MESLLPVFLQGVLCDQTNASMFPACRRCWKGGGIFVDNLYHIVKRLLVWISSDCRDILDEKLQDGLVGHIWIHDGQQNCIFVYGVADCGVVQLKHRW